MDIFHDVLISAPLFVKDPNWVCVCAYIYCIYIHRIFDLEATWVEDGELFGVKSELMRSDPVRKMSFAHSSGQWSHGRGEVSAGLYGCQIGLAQKYHQQIPWKFFATIFYRLVYEPPLF